MKKYHLLFVSSFICLLSFAQRVGIGISTPNASAMLDVTSTNTGMLVPRMNSIQRAGIASPAQGLLVYDTNTNSFWFFNASAWINLTVTGSGSGWALSGNVGINPTTHFIGTTDNQPLKFRVNNLVAGEINPLNSNVFFGLRAGENIGINGYFNTGVGSFSLSQNTNGSSNTALGYYALFKNTTGFNNTATGDGALFYNTTGYDNTATGSSALGSNTTTSRNTAIGKFALYNQSFSNGGVPWASNNVALGFETLFSNQPTSSTNGANNTAVGTSALRANTTGFDNTAVGTAALYNNTTGIESTAIGRQALFYNNTGYSNTATGYKALRENTTGSYNTAHGKFAIFSNTGGFLNTAMGDESMYLNTIGLGNTASGASSLRMNTSGNYNTAIGREALFNSVTGDNNTAVGNRALVFLTGGYQNIAIGWGSGTHPAAPNVYNTISIGNDGFLNAFQNQVFIGNVSTAFIGGQVNWSTYSDSRIKHTITEDVKGLDFITRLRPVSYHKDLAAITRLTGNKQTENFPGKYNSEKIRFSGFLAQEVEAAAKQSNYNFSGVHKPKGEFDLYSLSYAEFVVPLVKAVQEQQQIIENLNKKVEILIKEIQVIKQQKLN